eukprot:CFRG5111T1
MSLTQHFDKAPVHIRPPRRYSALSENIANAYAHACPTQPNDEDGMNYNAVMTDSYTANQRSNPVFNSVDGLLGVGTNQLKSTFTAMSENTNGSMNGVARYDPNNVPSGTFSHSADVFQTESGRNEYKILQQSESIVQAQMQQQQLLQQQIQQSLNNPTFDLSAVLSTGSAASQLKQQQQQANPQQPGRPVMEQMGAEFSISGCPAFSNGLKQHCNGTGNSIPTWPPTPTADVSHMSTSTAKKNFLPVRSGCNCTNSVDSIKDENCTDGLSSSSPMLMHGVETVDKMDGANGLSEEQVSPYIWDAQRVARLQYEQKHHQHQHQQQHTHHLYQQQQQQHYDQQKQQQLHLQQQQQQQQQQHKLLEKLQLHHLHEQQQQVMERHASDTAIKQDLTGTPPSSYAQRRRHSVAPVMSSKSSNGFNSMKLFPVDESQQIQQQTQMRHNMRSWHSIDQSNEFLRKNSTEMLSTLHKWLEQESTDDTSSATANMSRMQLNYDNRSDNNSPSNGGRNSPMNERGAMASDAKVPTRRGSSPSALNLENRVSMPTTPFLPVGQPVVTSNVQIIPQCTDRRRKSLPYINTTSLPSSQDALSNLQQSTNRKTSTGTSERRSTKKDITKKNNICDNCNTRDTTLWRRSKKGQLVCNPCGLYERVNENPRPMSLFDKFLPRRRKRRGSKPDISTSEDNGTISKNITSD